LDQGGGTWDDLFDRSADVNDRIDIFIFELSIFKGCHACVSAHNRIQFVFGCKMANFHSRDSGSAAFGEPKFPIEFSARDLSARQIFARTQNSNISRFHRLEEEQRASHLSRAAARI